MPRSAKSIATIQDELDAAQPQLSLFSAPVSNVEENTHAANGKSADGAAEKTPVKATARAKKQSAYSAADIQVLEGIEAIRHRPGMYIGSTSTSGLLHLLWEALDNSVDEAVAGYGIHVWIDIDRDGWVTVRDEGRGMPFDPMLY